MPSERINTRRTWVPELQLRGAYRQAYTPGTLREKLFDKGRLLPAGHPGARHRDTEALKRDEAAGAWVSLNK